MYFEGTRWTGLELAERVRRMSGGLRGAAWRPASGSWSAWLTAPRSASSTRPYGGAGAVVTPVLFLLSEAELRHVLTDSGAAFVVTTPEFLAKVQAAAAGTEVRAIIVSGALTEGSGGGPATAGLRGAGDRPGGRAGRRGPGRAWPRCCTPAARPAGRRA
jgi:long-chain acyl-CoA synthetase